MALVEFHLDPGSGVSYYVQLIQQVRQALLFGILKAGDRLPTVKEVSAQVALNPNTVLRAYRELEHDGLVVSRPGLGTFVAPTVPPAVAPSSYHALRADLERLIRKARARGVDDSRLASLFAHVMRENSEEVVA
jgi:GntR family transcriptional regulator